MAATNRIITALLALLLGAAAAIGVIEIIRYLLDMPPWVLPADVWTTATSWRWSDALVVVVGIVLVLLGLLLLVPALRRGAPRTVTLQPLADGVTAAADRKGLERLATSAVEDTSGVDSASVKARRGRLTVQATTSVPETEEVRRSVQATVDGLLTAVGPAKPVRNDIRVTASTGGAT